MKSKDLLEIKERKAPDANLKNFSIIFFQIGLLLTLIIFIVIVRIDLTYETDQVYYPADREIIEMEEILWTKQIETPPPPPRPPVPQAVPDNEIIEDFILDFNAELRLDRPLALPPPPPLNEEEEEEDFFVVVEQMPVLIGGLAELQSKIRYPEAARRAGIEGRVHVQFIVNERGKVEDPVVIRGIGGNCDEEALRAIREAKFHPGMQRGRPVRVQYSLPIVFRLHH